MDEIVKIVMSKSGLPEDKSRLAIKAIIEFLKQRLPEPLGTQVESNLIRRSNQGSKPIITGSYQVVISIKLKSNKIPYSCVTRDRVFISDLMEDLH